MSRTAAGRTLLRTAAFVVLLCAAACVQRPSEEEAPILFQEPANYHVGKNPTSVTVADLDGNGTMDLVTTNSNSHNISVLLGEADGLFREHVMFNVGTRPRATAASDLNGDGHLDLVVINNQSDNFSVLLGRGDGTFLAATHMTVGRSPMAVAAGDLDHDGHSDLAVVTRFDHLFILKGRGDGSFEQTGSYDPGDTPTAVLLDDLNNDTHPDLIVSNNGPMTSSIAVFLGLGDGTFRLGGQYAPKSRPLFAALGRLNADAHRDLAAAIPFANSLLVLTGNERGEFADPPNTLSGEVEPVAVAIEDFDNDGFSDLAVANTGSSEISVMLGHGDGTFGRAQIYRAAGRPISLISSDFNQDGWNDLAVANNGSSDVSVLISVGYLHLPASEPPAN